MKEQVSFLSKSIIIVISAFLITSCYTVQGAVKGAGKDVAVVVGQEKQYDNKKADHKDWKKKKMKKYNSKKQNNHMNKAKSQNGQMTNQNQSSTY